MNETQLIIMVVGKKRGESICCSKNKEREEKRNSNVEDKSVKWPIIIKISVIIKFLVVVISF